MPAEPSVATMEKQLSQKNSLWVFLSEKCDHNACRDFHTKHSRDALARGGSYKCEMLGKWVIQYIIQYTQFSTATFVVEALVCTGSIWVGLLNYNTKTQRCTGTAAAQRVRSTLAVWYKLDLFIR